MLLYPDPLLVLALIYNGRFYGDVARLIQGDQRLVASPRLKRSPERGSPTDSLWESLSWDRSFATSPPTKFDDAAIDESCPSELLQLAESYAVHSTHRSWGRAEEGQASPCITSRP